MGKAVLGEFEHHVLLAALRLRDQAYTAAIVTELEAVTEREVAPAAVYIALRRLEESGLAVSEMRAPADAPTARQRRYFTPTQAGIARMQESRTRYRALWQGVESLLSDGTA